jgi:hypothetical protein
MFPDRDRLALIVDDGKRLKLGFALRYHAQRLLIDCDQALLPGEEVTLVPLCDDARLDLQQIPALIVHHYVDAAPGRPTQRHMASLLIDVGPELHAILRDAIDRACVVSLRRGPRDQTHAPDVLNTARWA